MNTIKFRAWNRDENRMILWTEFTEKRYNLTDFALAAQYPALYAAGMFRNSILMQFTGLLDSTGKEIYERDILKGNLPFENSEEYPIVKVMWDDVSISILLCLINGDKGWIPVQWINGYEVIGNLYENPSLVTP